jgi:acetyl/propionyl-CoA carboxylase alpha subunit/acetyl-CoA carboxylase carboxyltransferase component
MNSDAAITFDRVAVLGPVEATARFTRTARELADERGRPIQVVALVANPRRSDVGLRAVDEVVALPALDALGDVLAVAGVDALWPGWHAVAEQPAVATTCEQLGVTFLGPNSDTLRRVRDRIAVKALAERAGMPVVPWNGGPLEGPDAAVAAAELLGYPVMLKAAGGGGRSGIRRVDSPGELLTVLEHAGAEALRAFGDSNLYLEALLIGARHLEVTAVADGHRNVWSFGPHDATLRRRGDKIVIESECAYLTHPEAEAARAEAAVLLRSAGYRGVATVAFLHPPDGGPPRLLEVYPRLPPEHAVVEETTGVDLVRLQLHIGQGGRLDGEPPATHGVALQARLNAEDPERGFAPAPGTVARLRLGAGPGVRVDAAVAEGDVLLPGDPMLIAQTLARGPSRDEARIRLRRTLDEATVVLDGGSTNKGFLLEVLDRPEVREARVDNAFVDRIAERGEVAIERDADLALLVAAVDAYETERGVDQSRFFASAHRGRPRAEAAVGRTIEFRFGGQGYRLRVTRPGSNTYDVELDGVTAVIRLEALGPFERRLHLGSRSARVVSAVQGEEHLVEVDGTPHRFRRDDQGVVRSPTPGVVVALPVAIGEEVRAGHRVAVIESMKMETAVPAPFTGRVRCLLAGPNEHVDTGTALVQLDPTAPESEAEHPSARLTAPGAEGRDDLDPRERCRRDLMLLRDLVLGYDVGAEVARATAADLSAACRAVGTDSDLMDAEHEVLLAFADLRALFREARDESEAELQVRAPQEHLHAYLRSLDVEGEGLPAPFLASLRRVLGHYGVDDLDRTPQLEEALYWIYLAQQRVGAQVPVIVEILEHWLEQGPQDDAVDDARRRTLERLVTATQGRQRIVADLAREVRFGIVDEPRLRATRDATYAAMREHLTALVADPGGDKRGAHMAELVDCPQPLAPLLLRRLAVDTPATRPVVLETMTRRYYRRRDPHDVRSLTIEGRDVVVAAINAPGGGRMHVLTTVAPPAELNAAARALAMAAAEVPADESVTFDVYTWEDEREPSGQALSGEGLAAGLMPTLAAHPERVVVVVGGSGPTRHVSSVRHVTFAPGPDTSLVEDASFHGLHPLMFERLQLWRLDNFAVERLPAPEDVYLARAVAQSNPKDQRLLAVGEVRDLTPVRDDEGRIIALPQLERVLLDALEGMRRVQAPLPPERRYQWNRVQLYVWPPFNLTGEEIERVARTLAPTTEGLGVEEVDVQCLRPDLATGEERERLIRLANPTGTGFVVSEEELPTEPLLPLDEYTRKVVQSRRRGAPYPYELVRQLTAPHAGGRTDVSGGSFQEYDLDSDGRLVPVDRPPGGNSAGIVVGLVTTFTDRYPEGMVRVALFGDPTKALGSLAEPECRRILAGLDLAESLGVPLEWYALSAGARIAMDSGTENMDWIAAVLRRLIEFTQAGHEVNIVVTGINVGGQPYWNAEATMLMHTKGILVMTPDSAMVLTGKQALDYSGSVSAEDNLGIGGYERIMGPNGQGQYWAPDLPGAIGVLMAHYDHTYVAPGERFPRRATTHDPSDRDVREFPHHLDGSPITTVGDIFSDDVNPERKLPFDIRTVMRAIADQDHSPLERWPDLIGGDTVAAWDAKVGGWPVAMLGIEGRALRRRGLIPADGPDQWTSGTLFPMSSKKVARVVNAASDNRPLVVVANLSGFDGSPESMRSRQLEFGAEIGRAVVNFRGPIVFVVVSRYHGGAFVVFSQKLNADLETIAVEGARASVIGGAPAAAVVFAGEVAARTRADERVVALEEKAAAAEGNERVRLRAEAAALSTAVRAEKLGDVAAEFDQIHSVERALEKGSISAIIPAHELRGHVIDAVGRGVDRVVARTGAAR